MIGLQARGRAAFGKALFHASLLSLCLIGVFSVLLSVVFGFGFSDFQFSLFLSLVPFAVLCPETELGLFLAFGLSILYFGLMTVSLWGVGKIASRTKRVIGRGVIVTAFGVAYAAGWYLTARAVAAAMAAVMMP